MIFFFAVGKYFYLVSLKDIMKVLDRRNSCDKDEEMMACILHGNVQNTTNYLRSKLSRIHEKTMASVSCWIAVAKFAPLENLCDCREKIRVHGTATKWQSVIQNFITTQRKKKRTGAHIQTLTILWALATTYQLPTEQHFSLLFRANGTMHWKLFICWEISSVVPVSSSGFDLCVQCDWIYGRMLHNLYLPKVLLRLLEFLASKTNQYAYLLRSHIIEITIQFMSWMSFATMCMKNELKFCHFRKNGKLRFRNGLYLQSLKLRCKYSFWIQLIVRLWFILNTL